MDDTLPITNNPRLPFFPSVTRESAHNSPGHETPQPCISVSDIQQDHESQSHSPDVGQLNSLEKW